LESLTGLQFVVALQRCMIERRALFLASSRSSQAMASAATGDHRSMPRAKVEITDEQLRTACKRFAQELRRLSRRA
jgi:hypothetical protein